MVSFQSAMLGIWASPKGFKIEELSTKLFHMFFDEEKALEKVLKGKSWLYTNSWVFK